MDGVKNPLFIIIKLYIASLDPAAPNAWPDKDLVEAIAGMAPYFPSPKTLLIASSSTESPTGVLVPCVLI